MCKSRTNNGRKPKKRLTKRLFLAILLSESILSYEATNKYAIYTIEVRNPVKLECKYDGGLLLHSRRVRVGSNGKKVSFNLQQYSTAQSEAEYIQRDDGGFAYARFNLGTYCYMHKDHETKNVYPLVTLIMTKSGSGKNCKVIGLITNTGLEPCGTEETDDLWKVLTPNKGSNDHTDFSELVRDDQKVYWRFHTTLITIKDPGSLDQTFSDQLLQMILTHGLEAAGNGDWVGLFNYDKAGKINNNLGRNPFAHRITPSKLIPRIIRDDLPGYYLGIYSGPGDEVEKFIQKSVGRSTDSHNRAYHFEFYVPKPSEILAGETYSLHLLSKGFSGYFNRLDFRYPEYVYEVRITRETGKLRFKIFRGTTEVTQLEEVYLDSDGPATNYIYFAFTVGSGIIYYKDETNVRYKTYETLTLFKVGGSTKRKHYQFEGDDVEDRYFIKSNSQVRTIYLKAELKASSGITENKPGFRAIMIAGTIGMYPAFLVASRDTQNDFPLCYFTLYRLKGCLSMAKLAGPDDDWTESSIDTWKSEVVTLKQTSGMGWGCKAPIHSKGCAIQKPGYIINLESKLYSRLPSKEMKLDSYDALSQEVKDYGVEFTNNLGTRYIVACPYSCNQVKFVCDFSSVFILHIISPELTFERWNLWSRSQMCYLPRWVKP